jgi:CHAT domain-containing protein
VEALGEQVSIFVHVLQRDLAEVKEMAGDFATACSLFGQSVRTEAKNFEARISPSTSLAEATGHRDSIDALSRYMRLVAKVSDSDPDAVQEAQFLVRTVRQRSIAMIREMRQACASQPELARALELWREVGRWLAWGRSLEEAGVKDEELVALALKEAELGAIISTLSKSIMPNIVVAVGDKGSPHQDTTIDFVVCIDWDGAPGDVRLYAFIQNPGSPPHLVKWERASTLLLDIEKLRREIEADRDVSELLQRLAKEFWQPMAKFLPAGGRLLIRPDGNIAHMPFPTLTDDDGRLLGQHYQFVFLTMPTATISAPADCDDFLILGDPAFSTRWGWRSLTGRLAASRRAIRMPSVRLPPLRFARREARKIGSMLRKSGLKGRVLLGRKAERNAILYGRRARILHIAAHAFYEPREMAAKAATHRAFALLDQSAADWRAGLLLANAGAWLGQNGPIDDSEDGLLLARDLSLTNLAGFQLVVLSACETTLGEPMPGDGIVSLPDAFLAAGVRTVVATLWSIDDYETADIMINFYKLLLAGNTVETALGQATISAARNGLHPRLWSGFAVFGEAGFRLQINQ